MILDGHVRGNKMIDMQMSNAKLNKRARRILMEELGAVSYTHLTLPTTPYV